MTSLIVPAERPAGYMYFIDNIVAHCGGVFNDRRIIATLSGKVGGDLRLCAYPYNGIIQL